MNPIQPNNTQSFVKFFDPKVLRKERELIDSWDYEICNQYGVDCMFVSQKINFPKIKLYPIKNDPDNRLMPLQNDLFFHAYGEISRPEYNEPFPTRTYIQFTEDLFAINGFGLNTDLNVTLIFNKTSFALDGALAMADNQTINKTFKFKTEIDESEKYSIVNYKSKNVKFKARFDWKKSFESLTEGELFEFDIDPENLVKPDVLNTFKRRYSARNFVEKSSLYFKCERIGRNSMNGNAIITGTCHAIFIVKNPWKAYSENLNRLTPSVGDIVLLNGIDNNIIKLELTEVESENKTAQGISPLLGSYSFKCTAKPYIADNSSSVLHDPIVAPTDINAKKLIIQTVLNHDASKITDNISDYEKLYTDEMGFDFTEDDVYGGYDLEPPNGLGTPPNVPINNVPINSNYRVSYKWNEFANKSIQIIDGKNTMTYSPDELYTYLKNMMDDGYTESLIRQFKPQGVTKVHYDSFGDYPELSSDGWYECLALNVPLWYDVDSNITTKTYKDPKTKEEKTQYIISAYSEPDRRLKQILNNNDLFNQFYEQNQPFFAFTNEAVYNGIPQKYEIPYMSLDAINQYIDVIKDKKDAYPIDIPYADVYELSSFEISVYENEEIKKKPIDRYIKNLDHPYTLRTDLYDIEQYNIGSSKFAKVVKDTTPEYKKWKEINIKKANGPLIPIYQFENNENSILATNGESLFFETTHNGQLYRSEISSFENDIVPTKVNEYNGLSVPLSKYLNWLEADNDGIYFNNAYGTRTRLYGTKEKTDEDKLSHLNFENDFSSPEDSFILTFKNSKYYLMVQPTETTFILKLCQ